jgi:phage-related protein
MPTPSSNNLDTWITTYSIPESPESNVEMQIRLHTTEFADGYSQRVADGTNNLRRVYTFVTHLLPGTAATAMRDFLKYYSQGEQILKNTSPTDGTQRKWWVQTWTEQLDGPLHHSFQAVLIEDR